MPEDPDDHARWRPPPARGHRRHPSSSSRELFVDRPSSPVSPDSSVSTPPASSPSASSSPRDSSFQPLSDFSVHAELPSITTNVDSIPCTVFSTSSTVYAPTIPSPALPTSHFGSSSLISAAPYEDLGFLERIFYLAKNEQRSHRVHVANHLASWLATGQIDICEAHQYLLPLLNNLAQDDDDVRISLAASSDQIVLYFFSQCPISSDPSDFYSNGPSDRAPRPTLLPSAFTSFLGTLLLDLNANVSQQAQNALVRIIATLSRSPSPEEDHLYEPYHFTFNQNTSNENSSFDDDRFSCHHTHEPYIFGLQERHIVRASILNDIVRALANLTDESVPKSPEQDTSEPLSSTQNMHYQNSNLTHSYSSNIDENTSPIISLPENILASSTPEIARSSSASPPLMTQPYAYAYDDHCLSPDPIDGIGSSPTTNIGNLSASVCADSSYDIHDDRSETVQSRIIALDVISALESSEISNIPDDIRSSLIPEVISLTQHPIARIRIQAAHAIVPAVRRTEYQGLPPQNLKSSLPDSIKSKIMIIWETLHRLLEDEVPTVRAAAIIATAGVLCDVSAISPDATDIDDQKIASILSQKAQEVEALLSICRLDRAFQVQTAILQCSGRLIYMFAKRPEHVPHTLLDFFLRPSEPITSTDIFRTVPMLWRSDNDVNIGEKFVTQEDISSERAYLCAYNIPAVALTLGPRLWSSFSHSEEERNSNTNGRRVINSSSTRPTLPPASPSSSVQSSWAFSLSSSSHGSFVSTSSLSALYTELSQNEAAFVRQLIASSAPDVARALGPDLTLRHVAPVFLDLLVDPTDAVRFVALEKFIPFMGVLDEFSSGKRRQQDGQLKQQTLSDDPMLSSTTTAVDDDGPLSRDENNHNKQMSPVLKFQRSATSTTLAPYSNSKSEFDSPRLRCFEALIANWDERNRALEWRTRESAANILLQCAPYFVAPKTLNSGKDEFDQSRSSFGDRSKDDFEADEGDYDTESNESAVELDFGLDLESSSVDMSSSKSQKNITSFLTSASTTTPNALSNGGGLARLPALGQARATRSWITNDDYKKLQSTLEDLSDDDEDNDYDDDDRSTVDNNSERSRRQIKKLKRSVSQTVEGNWKWTWDWVDTFRGALCDEVWRVREVATDAVCRLLQLVVDKKELRKTLSNFLIRDLAKSNAFRPRSTFPSVILAFLKSDIITRDILEEDGYFSCLLNLARDPVSNVRISTARLLRYMCSDGKIYGDSTTRKEDINSALRLLQSDTEYTIASLVSSIKVEPPTLSLCTSIQKFDNNKEEVQLQVSNNQFISKPKQHSEGNEKLVKNITADILSESRPRAMTSIFCSDEEEEDDDDDDDDDDSVQGLNDDDDDDTDDVYDGGKVDLEELDLSSSAIRDLELATIEAESGCSSLGHDSSFDFVRSVSPTGSLPSAFTTNSDKLGSVSSKKSEESFVQSTTTTSTPSSETSERKVQQSDDVSVTGSSSSSYCSGPYSFESDSEVDHDDSSTLRDYSYVMANQNINANNSSGYTSLSKLESPSKSSSLISPKSASSMPQTAVTAAYATSIRGAAKSAIPSFDEIPRVTNAVKLSWDHYRRRTSLTSTVDGHSIDTSPSSSSNNGNMSASHSSTTTSAAATVPLALSNSHHNIWTRDDSDYDFDFVKVESA